MKTANRFATVALLLSVSCSVFLTAQEPQLQCTNYIIITADHGLIVSEMNADEQRAPASMVKMILMLLVTEGVEKGLWTWDTEIAVSKETETIGGTQVFLKAGESWPLEALMKGVAVASANDAASAVAEGLWGSREEYLKAANERARELGMLDTVVNTPHGLPPEPGQESDMTTARDMSILARACVAKPKIMEWVAMKELRFRPRDEAKTNTNKLLEIMPECDGLKTGYTRAAGFCLTATAVRNDIRLIVVVMGCPKLADRFATAQALLEQGFAGTRRELILAKGDLLAPPLPVRNAKMDSIQLQVTDDLWVTARQSDFDVLEYVPHYPSALHAPMKAGDEVGTLSVALAGQELGEIPVILPADIEVPGWRWKLTHSVLTRLKGETANVGG